MMSEHDETTEPRRRFLKLAAGTAAAAFVAGSLPKLARAADLPHLTLSDPTAQALKYTEDASKVTDPKHKKGDDCANCMFYQGKAGATYGPCQLFPGKSVHSKGWCISHTPKA
ncbi:MAG: high-potential iron-sulfur protein [Xanthomonadales bacterium]|nr:high-potential iron-sulfur protein [Xanthomonadales bacterium]